MHFWILALVQRLVQIKQGSQDHQVKWTDFPLGDEKPEKTEFQVYVKDDEYEEEFVLWYKVIVYITVGKVMVQGKGYRSWCEEEFLITLDIVNSLIAEKDLLSSNPVPPLNTCGTFEHAESDDETFVKSVVSPSDPDPDTEIIFNLGSNVRSVPYVSPVKKQSVGENNSELNKQPNLDKLHETSKVENHTSSCDDDLYDSRFKKLHDRLSIFEDGVIKNTTSVLEVHTVLKQIQSKLDNISHAAQVQSNKLFDSLANQKEKSSCTLNDKYIKELCAKHSVELASVKNKLDMQEKENQYHKEKLSDLRKENNKLNQLNEQLKESNENIRIQYYEQKAVLEEKDSNIHKLQDRLQSIESELNGEKWQSVKPKSKDKSLQVELNELDPIEEQPSTNDTSNIEFVDLVNSNTNSSKSQDQEIVVEPEPIDFVLLHDSVCKHINLNRFLSGTTCASKGKSYTTFTIAEATEKLQQLPHVKNLVLHVAVNDLKNQDSAVQCFERYKSLIGDAQNKTDKLLLSLPLPSDEQPLQSNIVAFNSLVQTSFSNTTNIIINKNDNFAEKEGVNKKFYADSIHVNSSQGTKLLASNLKRAVFGPKISYAVRPAVPRSSYSDNKSQGELYSNIVRDRRPMNMMNNVPRFTPQHQNHRFPNHVSQGSVRNTNKQLPIQGNYNNFQAQDRNFSQEHIPNQPQPYMTGLNTSYQRREGNRNHGFQSYQAPYGQNKEFLAKRLTNSIKSAVFDMLNFQ